VGAIDLQFPLGVNYWPAGKAMYWWRDFEAAQVGEDFCRLAEAGFQVARIFLTWEDFQPAPGTVSGSCLHRLAAVADLAAGCKMMIQPTFFCGHMSGVNWMPEWALGGSAKKGRFPVMSGGCLSRRLIRNFYSDQEMLKAQKLQCREVARALRGHPALWAYDLGNESSNCVIPRDRRAARDWLAAMVGELKGVSDLPVTIGLHAEDLEEDRKLGPAEAALFCDFLCMHGYPFYLDWADHPLDAHVLPFLGLLTRWLGGKRVLFQEFGVSDQVLRQEYPGETEEAGAAYYRRALHLLKEAGMWGAFAWCYSDYEEHLFEKPPLKENPHERYFGLFKADGSPKKAAGVFQEFAKKIRDAAVGDKHSRSAGALSAMRRELPLAYAADGAGGGEGLSWLKGEDPERFYENPLFHLKRLYRSYKGRR